MAYTIPMPPAVQYIVYVLEVVSAERTLEKIVAVRYLHFMLRSRKVPLFEYFPHHLAVRHIQQTVEMQTSGLRRALEYPHILPTMASM